MILTVTMNPCVDKTVYVRNHEPHRIHRSERVTRIAGGKGVNVARTVRTLGETVVALVVVGGNIGRLILDLMAADGIPAVPVWVREESRTVTTILEADSPTYAQTAYVEPGSPITPEGRVALFRQFEQLLDAASLVLLTGPAPDVHSTDIYAAMAHECHQRGIPVFLDSRGGAFREAVEQAPTLVKPNVAEAAEWIGSPELDTEERQLAVVERLRDRGIPWVVLTLGPAGALVAVEEVTYRALPPDVPRVNPIGSGDALLGAMAVAWVQGRPAEEIIRWGLAAGAANAAVWEAAGCTREQIVGLVPGVELRRVDGP